MIPDPITVRVARQVPYSYALTHRLLGHLAARGWTDAQAERGVLLMARHGFGLDVLLSAGDLAPTVEQGLIALESA